MELVNMSEVRAQVKFRTKVKFRTALLATSFHICFTSVKLQKISLKITHTSIHIHKWKNIHTTQESPYAKCKHNSSLALSIRPYAS